MGGKSGASVQKERVANNGAVRWRQQEWYAWAVVEKREECWSGVARMGPNAFRMQRGCSKNAPQRQHSMAADGACPSGARPLPLLLLLLSLRGADLGERCHDGAVHAGRGGHDAAVQKGEEAALGEVERVAGRVGDDGACLLQESNASGVHTDMHWFGKRVDRRKSLTSCPQRPAAACPSNKPATTPSQGQGQAQGGAPAG